MIGNRIRLLRNEKGIYQQQLADILSVSKSTIAMWETDKREPDSEMLINLADYFNCSIDYLLGHTDERVDEAKKRGDKVLFVNRLKLLREERGLNMRQTAKKLEIPYTTYVGYEKNEREPNSEILLKLADFFNCSTDYLLGHTDDPAQIPNGDPTKRVKIAAPKGGVNMIRLKQLREERNVSQASVAKDLGISRQTYNNYELGKREADSAMLLTLADYFNCSIDYLLGHTNDPVPTAEDNSPKRLKAAVRRLHPKKPRAKKKKHDPTRRSRKAILERLKSYRPAKPEVRKEEETAMKEDLSSYVRELGRSLMFYSRNNVYRIIYISNDKGEFAEISFTDGSKKLVNITGDSCLAATLDITKALI